jgi:predicted nucleic acid-binding protein
MATATDTFLIADTSGLISLAVTTDSNHEPAVTATENLRGKDSTILIPYEVYIETLNVLGKRVGHTRALSVASYLCHTPLFLVIDSAAEARQEALARFATLPESVSFTDAVVMAVADDYGTKDIFGFDAVFAKNGYRLPGNGEQRAA